MKLATFKAPDGLRLGVVQGEVVIDLQAVDPAFPRDLGVILRSGDHGLAAVRQVLARAIAAHARPLAGIEFGLPLPSPGKIICLGLNYLDHVREGPYERQGQPTLFMRALSSLVPAGGAIVRPRVSHHLDYEAEMVAVIGRSVRHATYGTALDAVAGYSVFNDATVRDYQKHTVQWTMGKNFDGTGAFGPFFVTADELPPGAAGLRIESRLNGQVMQSDNTTNMIFNVADTIAFVTEGITLEPGDLLVMGTPAGVGYARKPPVFMKAGDLIEIEIEGIGLLANPVVDEPGAHALAAE